MQLVTVVKITFGWAAKMDEQNLLIIKIMALNFICYILILLYGFTVFKAVTPGNNKMLINIKSTQHMCSGGFQTPGSNTEGRISTVFLRGKKKEREGSTILSCKELNL